MTKMNNPQIKYLLAIVLLWLTFSVSAEKTEKQAEGRGIYYGTRDDSPAVCKARALENARVDALGKAFGTIVSQNVMTSESEGTENNHSQFLSLTSSEVKGEWLKDVTEPKYETTINDDNTLTVTCTVKVLGREIANECPPFETVTLRGRCEKQYASSEFNDSDDMFLWFKAAADGYVQVYLTDETDNVAGILPYDGSEVREVKVKAGEEYVFFSRDDLSYEFGRPKRYQMSTDHQVEFNKIYVIYSPNPFSQPVMKKERRSLPPMLSIKDFTDWRLRLQRNDPKLGVKQLNIRINGPRP